MTKTYRRTADDAASFEEDSVSATMTQSYHFGNGGGDAALIIEEKEKAMSEKTYAVRRLTPLECERLQGFPDGWTDIGEWVDSKNKSHKPADTPRYKALGNSVALPQWFAILGMISDELKADGCETPTMGSLFDGIGGFPYCWQMHNGAGTARWASEIEEFPIAVTKLRFGEE